jgi:hypothetical protein
VVRELTDRDVARTTNAAEHYVRAAAEYRKLGDA